MVEGTSWNSQPVPFDSIDSTCNRVGAITHQGIRTSYELYLAYLSFGACDLLHVLLCFIVEYFVYGDEMVTNVYRFMSITLPGFFVMD